MQYIIYATVLIVGFLIGWLMFGAKKTNGTLYIMHENEEKDIYRFEIDELENLSKHKKIKLKVKVVDFNDS